VILEAVENYDLWICHAFFGIVGLQNNINILVCSTVFARLVEGHALGCNYEINGHM
jgi:hypothetical protein